MCNVNCNGISLPTGPKGDTGNTGPSGSAGTNGTNGTNGTTILYVDSVDHSTTGTSQETLNTGTISGGTMITNGDTIKFELTFLSNNVTNNGKACAILIGDGVNTTQYDSVFENTYRKIKFTGIGIRTSSSTLDIYLTIKSYLTYSSGYKCSQEIDAAKVTISSLNFSNAFTVKGLATSIVTGDITEQLLEVDFLNK